MNKSELVAAVAEKSGLTKTDAASAVDAVFDVVQAELKKGGDVRLVGFGSFTVSHRAATKGRNPSTGAEGRHSGPQRAEVHGRQGPEGRRQRLI